MSDKEREILTNSFKEFAEQIGADEKDMANKILAASTNNYEGYILLKKVGLPPAVDIDVDHFIELVYFDSWEVIDVLLNDVGAFYKSNAEPLGDVLDFNYFIRKAKLKGFQIDTGNFIKEYFKDIPVLDLFGFDFNAHVRFYGEYEDCILISRSIGALARWLISNMVVSYIFPALELNHTAEDQGLKQTIVMERSSNDQYSIESVATDLFEVCKYISSPDSENSASVRALIKKYKLKSKISQGLALYMYHGFYNFVVYHEIAHIVLGHKPSSIKLRDEIDADVLAQNINMWDQSASNQPLLQPNWKGLNYIFYLIKAIGPVVLMNMYTIFRRIRGNEEYKTHPYPEFRATYLNILNSAFCSNSPEVSATLQKITKWIHELFIKSCIINGLVFEGEDISSNLDLDKFNVYAVRTIFP